MTALHVVCPHCDATNRVPQAKLSEGPKCGKCQQPLLAGVPLEVNAARFNKHIQSSDLPVLVDFWAPWCGPCKMMAPVFSEAAQQLKFRARLLKVNTEVEQALAGQFNIRSIPTLAVFKQGKELARQPGAMDLHNLVGWFNQVSQ